MEDTDQGDGDDREGSLVVSGVREARQACEARKKAVYAGTLEAVTDGDDITETDVVRRLMSGFDIEPDELVKAIVPLQKSSIRALIAGVGDYSSLISGAFMDGLLVGLFLAQARARETATTVAE